MIFKAPLACLILPSGTQRKKWETNIMDLNGNTEAQGDPAFPL